MQSVVPPRRLIASEFRQEMGEGESRPLLVAAYTEAWDEYFEIVLKLKDPDVPEKRHGGTGLACELICVMLARVLGFSVPDYFLINITEGFVDSVVDDESRARLEKNIGLSFGTRYLKAVRNWNMSRTPLAPWLMQYFSDLLDFDSAIVNGDRVQGAANILWNGKECFPIDHGLTLEPCRHTEQQYKTFLQHPLLPDDVIKAHISRDLLLWRDRPASRVIPRWNEQQMPELLRKIRAELPTEWESAEGDYDRIFDLLHRRTQHFDAISKQLRRLVA